MSIQRLKNGVPRIQDIILDRQKLDAVILH